MEELFRFSVIRAADRSNAPTVSLERPAAPPPQQGSTFANNQYLVANYQGPGATTSQNFQDQLRGQVQMLTNDKSSTPAEIWKQLEPIAIDFLIKQANTILTNSLWASIQDFLDNINKLIASGTGDSKTTSAISSLFDKQGAQKNNDGFTSYKLDLADLFIALLIVRRGGTSNLDRLIRSYNPPLWDFTELLNDRPTLQDVNDHINAIDLIQSGAATLNATTAKTPADIQAAIQAAYGQAINKTLLLPRGIFAPFEKPVHGIGFREFHVVKQHIRGYELGEIAKIENILKGESRDHSTKHTLSNDTTTFNQTVSTNESTKELDTTDHTNIQNETQDQVKEDTKVDAGVHASYDGGSYKIQADLTVAYDKSSDSTRKFASDVSKDVTQKATTKVTQQVTQSQTVQIIETLEENENQKFDNKTGGGHISGVYQWVNKVYLAQTFNIGRHLLFDLMIPEPAGSYVNLMINKPANPQAPVKPAPLGELTPGDLNTAAVANEWIGKYQATGVDPYPFDPVIAAKALVFNNQDDSKPQGADTITLQDGFYAATANVSANWIRNDNVSSTFIEITVGDASDRLSAQVVDGMPICKDSKKLTLNSGEQGTIGFAFTTYNVNGLSINIEVICRPSSETIARWQQQAYEKIVTAYQKLEADYEAKMATLQFQGTDTGPLGNNPDANRATERQELKRSCVAIIDNANETVRGMSPNVAIEDWPLLPLDPGHPQLPEPILSTTPDAMGNMLNQELGTRVRWFEQAFEWENMAYLFYPYYWGRRGKWQQNLGLNSDDPLFINFLQAGYARVVVPVRLGFEKAVHFYLHTGLPWLGGGLPSIGDKTQNPLYLDIAEEIKAVTGGGEPNEIEVPIGDPWEIKLPTTLIKLRKDDLVPSWNRIGPNLKPDAVNYPSDPPVGEWTWSEDKTPAVLPYTTS